MSTFNEMKQALADSMTLPHAEGVMREAKHLRREGRITQFEHENLRGVFGEVRAAKGWR